MQRDKGNSGALKLTLWSAMAFQTVSEITHFGRHTYAKINIAKMNSKLTWHVKCRMDSGVKVCGQGVSQLRMRMRQVGCTVLSLDCTCTPGCSLWLLISTFEPLKTHGMCTFCQVYGCSTLKKICLNHLQDLSSRGKLKTDLEDGSFSESIDCARRVSSCLMRMRNWGAPRPHTFTPKSILHSAFYILHARLIWSSLIFSIPQYVYFSVSMSPKMCDF